MIPTPDLVVDGNNIPTKQGRKLTKYRTKKKKKKKKKSFILKSENSRQIRDSNPPFSNGGRPGTSTFKPLCPVSKYPHIKQTVSQVCLRVGCFASQQRGSVSQGWSAHTSVRAGTLRRKLQTKLSISPSRSLLILDQPVPALPYNARLLAGLPL